MSNERVVSSTAAAGFTLLEVLVALAVFSLAALALLRLQGASIATTSRLDEKLIAAIVIQNQATLLRLQTPAPAYGALAGRESNARREWPWTANVTRTPDPALQRIDISVAGPDGAVLARQTIVRPNQ